MLGGQKVTLEPIPEYVIAKCVVVCVNVHVLSPEKALGAHLQHMTACNLGEILAISETHVMYM